jgi:hypothetical protein
MSNPTMPKKAQTPSLEQWKRLFDLMSEISSLAPWTFMYEHDLIGIEFPARGGLGYVSVMGNLGQHYAVTVYRGKQGLDGFLKMQHDGYKLSPDVVLQTPQVQASFEDRQMLQPEDRSLIEKLNLKFRGKHAWPFFRSYRPGCFPWFLEKEEAQILILSLEQLIDVAPRFEKNPDMLGLPEPDGSSFMRVRKNDAWVDRRRKPGFPADPPIRLRMNADALNKLKNMKMQDAVVEVDIKMMEQAVKGEEFDRPFFPFMLLVAENHSRMILGFELLCPLPSLDEMWGLVPEIVARILAQGPLLPKEIRTKDPWIAFLLSPLDVEIESKVKLVSRLPAVENAQRELRKYTRR